MGEGVRELARAETCGGSSANHSCSLCNKHELLVHAWLCRPHRIGEICWQRLCKKGRPCGY